MSTALAALGTEILSVADATFRCLPDGPMASRLRNAYWRRRLRAGFGFSVLPGTVFVALRGIRIGKRCSINRGCLFDATTGTIEIGNDVLVGPYVVMRAANHLFDDPGRPIREQGHRGGEIKIEDDVWIGAHVVILSGVTVARGTVVGAGAVVTKSWPAFSILGGVPARPIANRRG